jgi:hypothetical protein
MNQQLLENNLDNFDPQERREVLETLAGLVSAGKIALPPKKQEVNLHYHTFFSFNAEGWSPSHICWEAAKYGLEIAGTVDFDVLDGMDEFLAAGELLGQKAVVGLETRLFVAELADKVINSPNEPGIAYFVVTGCHKLPTAGSKAETTLNYLARLARSRNQGMVERINAYLDEVQLDYDADVIPLTPLGNATERHLLTAYERKAKEVFGGDSDETADFWSAKLATSKVEITTLDQRAFHDLLRKQLMKFGGIGYAKPESGSFPKLEDVISLAKEIDAIPVIAWLDGMSDGEADANALIELYVSKGTEALSIVPDRNWNIKDPETKAAKIGKLDEIVRIAGQHDLPIMIGTEMNSAGLPFVDDFSAPELAPYVPSFLEGARRIYERYADSSARG